MSAAMLPLEPARRLVRQVQSSYDGFAELERVIDRMLAYGLDRGDVVVALGGGVVGDLAGLAAALFMRGIDGPASGCCCLPAPVALMDGLDAMLGHDEGAATQPGERA